MSDMKRVTLERSSSVVAVLGPNKSSTTTVGGGDTSSNRAAFIAEPFNPNIRAMYCKDRVYADDGVERSFEELRAVEWLRNQGAARCLRQQLISLQAKLAQEQSTCSQLQLERAKAQQEQSELQHRLAEQTRLVAELSQQLQQQKEKQQQTASGRSHITDPPRNSAAAGVIPSCLADSTLGMAVGSPTVNTREALNFVRRACDDSMDSFAGGRELRVPAAARLSSAPPAAQPFVIHVDSSMMEADNAPPPVAAPSAAPVHVAGVSSFDKENKPPQSPLAADTHKKLKLQQPVAEAVPARPSAEDAVMTCAPEMPPPTLHNTTTTTADVANLPLQPGADTGTAVDACPATLLDNEPTGYCQLPDITSLVPDPMAFAAGACRVTSTPFISDAQLRAELADKEEQEFTSNVYRQPAVRPAGVSVKMGGSISTIMEASREKFCSSSSGAGSSDPSAPDLHFTGGGVSACGVGVTVGCPSVSACASSSLACVARTTAAAADTLRSGYLGDGSSMTPCAQRPSLSVHGERCLSPRPPSRTVDQSTLEEYSGANVVCRRRQQSDAHTADLDAPAAETARALADLSLSFQPPADLTMPLPPLDAESCSPVVDDDGVSADSRPGNADTTIQNPWEEALLTTLLDQLTPPLAERSCFLPDAGKMPNFGGKRVELGEEQWSISLIGEGSYARVYRAVGDTSGHVLCLKVQRADARWEVYIVDELRRRLGAAYRGHIMPISLAFLYTNGTVICTEYQPAGTVLDLCNEQASLKALGDTPALLFTAEMLGIVADLNSAGIVHADIKPDNFLVRSDGMQVAIEEALALKSPHRDTEDLASSFPSQPLLQLIDFGRAIDMRLLPAGVRFRRRVNTACFACPEMLSGRAWSYHTDLFGVAATAYLLLFGVYMKLSPPKRADQRWAVPAGSQFRRFWSIELWREFFDQFLNLPESGEHLPDLRQWRRRMLDAVSAESRLRDKLSQILLDLKKS